VRIGGGGAVRLGKKRIKGRVYREVSSSQWCCEGLWGILMPLLLACFISPYFLP